MMYHRFCCRSHKPTEIEQQSNAIQQLLKTTPVQLPADHPHLHCQTRSHQEDILAALDTHSLAYCLHQVYTSSHVCRESCHMDLEEQTNTAMTFDLYLKPVISKIIFRINLVILHNVITRNQWATTITHYHPLHSFLAIWVCTVIEFNLICIIQSLSLQSCVLVVTMKQNDTIHAEVLANWSSQQILLWACWDSALVSMVTNQQGLLGDVRLHQERTWNWGRDRQWLLSELDSFLLKDPGKVHRKHENAIARDMGKIVSTTYLWPHQIAATQQK